MTFKKSILLSFLLLCSIISFAQKKRKVYPKFGIVAQGTPLFNPIFGEVGVVMRKNMDNKDLATSIADAFIYSTSELGIEFAKAGDDWIIAPKATCSLIVLVLEGRLNAVAFFKDGKVDPRIVPEIGLNVGYVSIYVGWNAPLSKTQHDEISLIRTSLIFKITL